MVRPMSLLAMHDITFSSIKKERKWQEDEDADTAEHGRADAGRNLGDYDGHRRNSSKT
jgi:hypothetical protein